MTKPNLFQRIGAFFKSGFLWVKDKFIIAVNIVDWAKRIADGAASIAQLTTSTTKDDEIVANIQRHIAFVGEKMGFADGLLSKDWKSLMDAAVIYLKKFEGDKRNGELVSFAAWFAVAISDKKISFAEAVIGTQRAWRLFGR